MGRLIAMPLSCSVSAALCLGSFLAVDTALAGLPGEPLCEVGLDTQKQVAAAGFKNVLTLGLANDYLSSQSPIPHQTSVPLTNSGARSGS